MKKLLLIVMGSLSLSFVSVSQNSGSKILDGKTGKPIEGATVKFYGPVTSTIKSSHDGVIDVSRLPKGKYTVVVTANGYEAYQREVSLSENNVFQSIALKNYDSAMDLNREGFEYQSDALEYEGLPMTSWGLLTSTRDPFNNAANYTFSSARFNSRGFAAEYGRQYLNGAPMNDMNTGYNVWSLWGGLNDVFRNQTSSFTFEPLECGFGFVGISNNVDTRASSYGKRRQITYSNSNRTYTNRAMLTYATGMMSNGWAFTASLSRRWGDGLSSYVRGTFYDATSAFLSVERKLGEYNSLNLTALVAPTRRGVASASTQEAYDIVGSNFYNPNMGMQNGKWRNARVRSNFEPLAQLSHYFEPNKDFKMTTTFSVRGGWNKYSALNWYNAPDPRPDYYRRMPSYYNEMVRNESEIDPITEMLYKDLWASDRNTRYINWDQLYDINRNNETTVYDINGNPIVTGRKALYMIEDRHTDQFEWAASSWINWSPLSWLNIDFGVNYRNNTTENYTSVGDLLGADFVYDIDKFAERDFVSEPEKIQIDLNNPDHIAYEGDRFGYNYKSLSELYSIWTNLSYDFNRLQAYTAFNMDYSTIQRQGLQRRGLFPDNSFGYSEKFKFLSFAGKLGLTYRINGHNYLSLNGLVAQKAPNFKNTFISPRTRNSTVNDLKNQNIYSAELSYIIRHPFISGRLTGFYAYSNNGLNSMSFYDDTQSTFSNYAISDIATQQMGVEAGLEAKLTTTLSATGAVAVSSNKYANNPKFVQTADNSAEVKNSGTIYWNGLNMASGPQTVATVGLTYRAPWYGTFGINANYFGRNFISMNPVVRTDVGRTQLDYKYILPENMKGGYTVDVFAGYSYRITWDTYLRFNLSVNNILNNKNIVAGGFEQLRVRTNKVDDVDKMVKPFPSKYSYMYGTTFFFNVSLQF